MPANRSRTEHWRDQLRKVFERNGGLEITIDRGRAGHDQAPAGPTSSPGSDSGADLIWRCRLVALTDTLIAIEPPAAAGVSITLPPGVPLIAGMTVGQNRWMFHTRTTGVRDSRSGPMITLEMPDHVERCTRRGFFRISTADLRLPEVQCWPLLSPASVIAPEAANRALIEDVLSGRSAAGASASDPETALLPEVGPMFTARLLNLSGGGLGLMLKPEDGRALDTRPYIWMRIDLRPDIPAPVAVTGKLAHTHLDSSQNLYAGLAFDFSYNPSHRGFVSSLLTGYVQRLQSRAEQAAKAA